MKKLISLVFALNLAYAINIGGIDLSHVGGQIQINYPNNDFFNSLAHLFSHQFTIEDFFNLIKHYNDACSNPSAALPSVGTDNLKVCIPTRFHANLDACAFLTHASSLKDIFKVSGPCVSIKKDILDKILDKINKEASNGAESLLLSDEKDEKVEKEAESKASVEDVMGSKLAQEDAINLGGREIKDIKDYAKYKEDLMTKLSLSPFMSNSGDEYKFNEDLENYKQNYYIAAFNNEKLVFNEKFYKNLSDAEKKKYAYFMYKQAIISSSIKGMLKELESYEVELKGLEKAIDEVCSFDESLDIKDFKGASLSGSINFSSDFSSLVNDIANFGVNFATSFCCLCAPAINDVKDAVKEGAKGIIKAIQKETEEIVNNLKDYYNALLKEEEEAINYQKYVLLSIYKKEMDFNKLSYCTSLKLEYIKAKINALNTKAQILSLLSMSTNELAKEEREFKKRVLIKRFAE